MLTPAPTNVPSRRGLVLLLLSLTTLAASAAAPPNNNFASATALNGSVVTLNNQTGAGATAETLDPYIGPGNTRPTHTVWYRFDAMYPQITKNHILVTHALAANIAVFTLNDPDGGEGSLSPATGAVVLANNNTAGTDALTFTTTSVLAPATRYYVCVDTPGAFSITLQLPAQNNYFFKDATVLTGNQGSITSSNLNCLSAGDAPATHSGYAPTAGVWYSWTPATSATYVMDTNFSYLYGTTIHQTTLTVFTGTSLANLVALNSDRSGADGARVSFFGSAGTTYSIWVGTNYYYNPNGTFQLEWFQEGNVGTFDMYPSAAPISVASDQGIVTLQVRRRYAGNVPATVKASTFNGTAVAGTDFTGITNQLVSFSAPGTASDETPYLQTFTFTLLPHAVPQAARAFSLFLSGQTAGGLLGSSSVNIAIVAYAPTTAPGFETPTMSVASNPVYVDIPITRASAIGYATITIQANATGGDTAVAPTDYLLETPALTFAPGQTSATVRVYIFSVAKPHGNKIFTLTVVPALPGVPVVGSPTIAVTIIDSTPPRPIAGRISTQLEGYGLYATLLLNIASNGTVTGRISMDKANYVITGKFDVTGLLTFRFGAGATPSRTLTVQLTDSVAQTYQVKLTDNVLGGQESITVPASHFSAASPCPSAGSYTCVDNAAAPLFACAFKVDALGNATLTGKAFDGTAITAVGAVDDLGNISAGTSLYAGQGSFVFYTTLLPFNTYVGIANFVRPGPADQTVVLPAEHYYANAIVSTYLPPATGHRLYAPWDVAGLGTATLHGGGFAATTLQNLFISPANLVTLTGSSAIPSLKLALTPATGLFTGTVIPPGATKPLPIIGVLIQNSTAFTGGSGFFLNGLNQGEVVLK